MRFYTMCGVGLLLATALAPARAQVIEYGDEDMSNTGVYSSNPKAGATQIGLAPGVVTFATNRYSHGFPFSPTASDYAGTDQIYVGTTQTSNHDGYSNYAGRIHGPQVITLDYSPLLSGGRSLQTLTLGIAADDFQAAVFKQPFTATVNGVTNTALTNALNGVDQTGPVVQYLTVGIDPTLLTSSNVLTLTINEGGDGGDGWSVDFLTVGVTSVSTVPEPGSVGLLAGLAAAGAGVFARRRSRARRAA